jgi:hypothetical protein
MNHKNYLPRGDQEFLVWITTFLLYLMSRVTKFKVPQDEYDGLDGERNTYAQKLAVANADATRTPMSIQGKNDAKEVLDKHTRRVVKSYLINNPILTHEDLKMLGLPIHKTTRTPVPPPTELVQLQLRTLTGNRVEVNFYPVIEGMVSKERHEAKPFGVRGAEIRWAILPAPPASQAELVHSEFDTRSPYMFQFDIPDAGKTLYVCARWENTTGQKGPWGKIVSTIIP